MSTVEHWKRRYMYIWTTWNLNSNLQASWFDCLPKEGPGCKRGCWKAQSPSVQIQNEFKEVCNCLFGQAFTSRFLSTQTTSAICQLRV